MSIELPVPIIAYIAHERLPGRAEFFEFVNKVQSEAFPGDHSSAGMWRAWKAASIALAGSDWVTCKPKMEALLTFPISLSTGSGANLYSEVHASATSALPRAREMSEAGADLTIMGPNGERLSETDLVYLSEAESDDPE